MPLTEDLGQNPAEKRTKFSTTTCIKVTVDQKTTAASFIEHKSLCTINHANQMLSTASLSKIDVNGLAVSRSTNVGYKVKSDRERINRSLSGRAVPHQMSLKPSHSEIKRKK